MKKNNSKNSVKFIVIWTSLVWIIVDVFLLMFFVDLNTKCFPYRHWISSNQSYSSDLPIPESMLGVKERSEESLLIPAPPKPIADNSVKLQNANKTMTHPRSRIIPSEINIKKDGPGENGGSVYLTSEFDEIRKKRFYENEFDVYVSEMISLNRTLKDVRAQSCKTREYPWNLSSTSIVIVYHNEAWTTLLRNLHSIINRTPKELLTEIILVDDCSDRPHLFRPLDDYLLTLRDKVYIHVIRLKERMGLIKARIIGAEKAKAPILTFLDAHCEVSVGWLEPLLAEIYYDKTRVVSPVIDIIHANNFAYLVGSDISIGAFDWSFNFRWYECSQREIDRRKGDTSLPMWTPTIAGGLFSIDKEYFNTLGAYDTGMEVWGTENLEISFRVWMCGGTLEIIPCSRVGHIFRDKSPYVFPGGASNIIFKNQRRLIDVWLDEWKDFYYRINPNAKEVEAGNLIDRINLRKNLKCKSFRWFLENVFPETSLPKNFKNLVNFRGQNSNLCMDTMNRKVNDKMGLFMCQESRNQLLNHEENLIRNNDECLEFDPQNNQIILKTCRQNVNTQLWDYDEKDRSLRPRFKPNMCVGRGKDLEDNSDRLTIDQCDGQELQRWLRIPVSI